MCTRRGRGMGDCYFCDRVTYYYRAAYTRVSRRCPDINVGLFCVVLSQSLSLPWRNSVDYTAVAKHKNSIPVSCYYLINSQLHTVTKKLPVQFARRDPLLQQGGNLQRVKAA